MTGGGGISRRRFVRDGAALAAGTALGVPAMAAAQQPAPAEILFRGGHVLTMRGDRVAEAVAVSGGRIAYVGSDSGAAAHIGPAAEVVACAAARSCRVFTTATAIRWAGASR